MKKKKILMISDHAASTSGVAVQSRFLAEGLVAKGDWTIRQLGAAVKHANHDVVQLNPDIIIRPIDGFGNPEMLRVALATEKPDVLLIFTDPRFFIWLFEMEDEIHQICPIAYWHVWDNWPRPDYNDVLYESTDLLNCHSYLTYEICKQKWADRTNFVPHALPESIYHPISDDDKIKWRKQLLPPGHVDNFLLFWMNRNAKRKRPTDVLWAWKIFLDKLEKTHGHKKATLIMHTDPRDQEGPNLIAAAENMGIVPNVIFSTERIDFPHINALHNISDACINIAFAEGFGLCTLEAMQTGTPIIAAKTGGLTRQVVDHRDGTENGIALPIEFRSIVGSQMVPYIYEDYVSAETVASAIWDMHEMGDEKRRELGSKARDYVKSEFAYQKTIDLWDESLKKVIADFPSRMSWEKNTI